MKALRSFRFPAKLTLGLTAIGLLLSCILIPWTRAHEHPHFRARTPVRIPDIPGYRTLKCDFHIHTIFSDGKVWPDIRAEEAWREGLDVIAITDHLEYQPHKADVSTNHNRSYEIAKPYGDNLKLTVIKGSEITRKMPPGHFNAIFLTNSTPLAVDDWHDAFKEAKRQGAFIFWNHPGWEGQQADGVARWYKEHTELYDQGFMNGVEVVNARDYYPEAHKWCIEKNLTMMSNSDIHSPLNLDYEVHEGDHRPLTLVFATDAGPAAVKEALFAHRTAVYSANRLVGSEEFLKPIFLASVKPLSDEVRIKGKGSALIQIQNNSDIDYELEITGKVEGVTLPKELVLAAGKTVLLQVTGTGKANPGTQQVRIPIQVKNLLVAPNEPLKLSAPLRIEFVAP